MHTERLIRSPLLAGIFYPSDSDQLQSEMNLLAESAKPLSHPACAIIAPHGSLMYSGKVVAKAWGALIGAEPSLIAIAGPAHLPYEEGVFLPESAQFEIPGGLFSVDISLEEYLLARIPALKKNDLPHLEDHSIEMQLPFAAHFFPGVPILPFVVSGRKQSTVDTTTELLKEIRICVGNQGVLVISSDLAVSDTAEECDSLSKEFIASLSVPGNGPFHGFYASRHSFCGEAAIRAFRAACPEARPTLLDYSNSAAFKEHSDELVVGYGAIGFKE
jgi:AmmeMemoRadiSam system protein B